MHRERSKSNVTEKFKSYVSRIMMTNFSSLNKIDKYFRISLSESMSKAIEANWTRILGIDYDIITENIQKDNQPLGIALGCRHMTAEDSSEEIAHHYLKVIRPNNCIGYTGRFLVGDELLEVNGLKIMGLTTKEVIRALKKLPDYIQVVVARSRISHIDNISDNGEPDEFAEPISFYDMDEDLSSRSGTLKSNSSLFSTTSRDYGSTGYVGDQLDGQNEGVRDYLRDITGWRGPIVLEFRKQYKESLGLALEEIEDPITSELIIVLKIIVHGMKAAKDGRLHVGDRLLQVNGKSVIGVSFRKICQWMKNSPSGKLILYICKPFFPTFNIDSDAYDSDHYLCNTLTISDKLPNLNEETDEQHTVVIPPVPTSYENHLNIKRLDEKLGLYLDISDNGKNGCRIKNMVNGQAKENGVLHNGDYITNINGISLRVNEKNKLEQCLRTIAKSHDDYQISYLTKEDVELHKSKYSGFESEEESPNKRMFPNQISVMVNNCSDGAPKECKLCEQSPTPKASFKIFELTISNDGVTNMGLKLIPSLNDPTRYVAITDIHADSLADRCQLLKINDEILSVNDSDFESLSPAEVGRTLKSMMQTETLLKFKIKRLINADNECHHKDEQEQPLSRTDNQYSSLSDLPDMYFLHLTKLTQGFGLSVYGLPTNHGVVVKEVDDNGAADHAKIIKPGQRFVIINNCPVTNCSVDIVIKLIKSSQQSIGLIMETPKYREFDVRVTKDSSNSLGLNVGGGTDTKLPLATIESTVANTTCRFSEPLQTDDLIVEVNGLTMFDLDHDTIIKILRALPRESNFKIWRKLPLEQRPLLTNIESTSFLDNYRQCCQFSVTIAKPVHSVPSFGLSFCDIVILHPATNVILCRYKMVLSIDSGCLIENFAPEVTRNCYLIAINKTNIDVTITCDQLKELIDSQNQVELLFSRDVPYRQSVESEMNDLSILNDSYSNYLGYDNPKDLDHHNRRVHFENAKNSTDLGNIDSLVSQESFEIGNDVIDPQLNVKNLYGEKDNFPEKTLNSEDQLPIFGTVKDNLDEDQLVTEVFLNKTENQTIPCQVKNTDFFDITVDEEDGFGMETEQLCLDEEIIKDNYDDEIFDKIDLQLIPNDDYSEEKKDFFDPTNSQSISSENSPKLQTKIIFPIVNGDENMEENDTVQVQEMENEISSSDEGCPITKETSPEVPQDENHQRIINEEDLVDNFNSFDGESFDKTSDSVEEDDSLKDKTNSIFSDVKIPEDKNGKENDVVQVQEMENEPSSFDESHSITKETSPEVPQDENHQRIINEEDLTDNYNSSDGESLVEEDKTNSIFSDDQSPIDSNSIIVRESGNNSPSFDQNKLNFDSGANDIHEEKELLDVGNEDESVGQESSPLNPLPINENIDVTCPTNQQLECDLGITIDNIVVPMLENMELGFHIIGGLGGGPHGETLPIYVVGAERHTRNWPDEQEQPWLNNGLQLLELNGTSLAVYDVSTIEKLIATAEGDLYFKVIKLK